MKGIILAGGSGTRLYPLTQGISKHLLPIYDKPMIYYPLSTLMLAGIQDILIIVNPRDINAFQALLGTGEQWGVRLQYAEQAVARGVADAFRIGASFIGTDTVTLILGDNVFYSEGLTTLLEKASSLEVGAKIFAYYVNDPRPYGVIEFNRSGQVIEIQEKPEKPRSNYVVPGIYFYDNSVIQKAQVIQPSNRGELEIGDINEQYRQEGKLAVEVLGRGMAWLDAGTYDSLLQASNFIEAIESRQGLKIACLEEIAYRRHLISLEQVNAIASQMHNTAYGQYLLKLCREEAENKGLR